MLRAAGHQPVARVPPRLRRTASLAFAKMAPSLGDASLAALYAGMGDAELDGEKLLKASRTLLRTQGGAQPVPFAEPFRSVRLLAAPVVLPPPALRAVLACLDECLSTLPPDGVFRTPVGKHHVTLFHTGRPGDARPTDAAGVEAEVALLRPLLSSTPPFALRVEQLLLTDTGVLVLLYQTDDGAPLKLRSALRSLLPASPAQQTVLLHSSLARLMDVPSPQTVAAIRARCAAATAELQGAVVRFDRVWHVVETSLPCDGDVTALPLMQL